MQSFRAILHLLYNSKSHATDLLHDYNNTTQTFLIVSWLNYHLFIIVNIYVCVI